MDEQDQLSEFTILKNKPKDFYIVFAAMLLVTCFATIPVLVYLKNMLTGYAELSLTQVVLFSVITAYPIFGCYSFYNLKKFGWIICAHYSLSATIIIIITIFSENFATDFGIKQIIKIICEILFGISSVYTFTNLFTKKYLVTFFINKSYIFLAFLLTILFPLFWFGILVTIDRMN